MCNNNSAFRRDIVKGGKEGKRIRKNNRYFCLRYDPPFNGYHSVMVNKDNLVV